MKTRWLIGIAFFIIVSTFIWCYYINNPDDTVIFGDGSSTLNIRAAYINETPKHNYIWYLSKHFIQDVSSLDGDVYCNDTHCWDCNEMVMII